MASAHRTRCGCANCVVDRYLKGIPPPAASVPTPAPVREPPRPFWHCWGCWLSACALFANVGFGLGELLRTGNNLTLAAVSSTLFVLACMTKWHVVPEAEARARRRGDD